VRSGGHSQLDPLSRFQIRGDPQNRWSLSKRPAISSLVLRVSASKWEQQVVAAAGVDAVVDERLPVGSQRDAPDDTIESSAKKIHCGIARALLKPDRIVEL